MNWLHYTVDYGVVGILIFMSVIGVGIGIERYFVYRSVRLEEYKDKKSLELALTSRLHILAIIGSNAPYVGLLGTVMGIMLTFYTMGKSGFMDTGKIMLSLALALKVTAIGLLVAIPAIIIYNLLLRRTKVLLMRWEIDNG